MLIYWPAVLQIIEFLLHYRNNIKTNIFDYHIPFKNVKTLHKESHQICVYLSFYYHIAPKIPFVNIRMGPDPRFGPICK